MRKWVYIRLFVLMLFAVGTCFSEDELADIPWTFLGFSCLAIMIFIPIMIVVIISGFAHNPLTSARWRGPSWKTNFLNLRDPLHFFHFGGCISIILGLVRIARTLLLHLTFDKGGLLSVFCGLAVLSGVRLCLLLFKKKYRPETIERAQVHKNWRKSIIMLKVVGTLIILSSIGPLAFGAYSLITTCVFLQDAVKTNGTITEFKEWTSSGELNYSPVIAFTDAEGKDHTFVRNVSSTDPSCKVGDTVPVLYDPKNPDMAAVNSFTTLWLFSVLFVPMGIISLVIGVLCWIIPAKIARRLGGFRKRGGNGGRV